MGKDTTAFRERFNAYKNGKSVSEIYDAGLPRYATGTPGLTKAQEAALDELYEWGSSNGLDLFSISGISGNGLQESGLDSDAVSKSGYAGTWQNSKNLQAAIIDKYGNHSKKSQLDYAKAWINGEEWVRKGKHSAHTAMGSGKFKKSGYKTAEEASDAWMKLYERPVILDANGKVIGYQELGKRRAYSKLAYLYLSNKYGKPQIPAQEPSPYIARPVSTAVRPIIPAEQTVPAYNPTINPYISGKPMVKLRPRVQLPNLIELMEDSEWEPGFPGLKNGKLPKYEDGTPTKVGEYNVYPSAVGASELNVTVPEVTVTGTNRRPMYQRYDAENSTYDPDAIRNFTDLAPIVGDVGLGLDAYNAFKNKDYTTAAILGGLTILPNAAENFGKYTYKGLRQLGVSQDFARDILLNGEAAWKRFKNLDVFDKLRGIKYTDDVYHGSRNVFDINHARPYAPAGMDSGFHMGSSPTPAYSRANGLEGGALYSGKLKLKEEPFELPDLGRWSYTEITREANKNPQFKKYLEDKGIDVDKLFKKGDELDKEYRSLDGYQQSDYLKQHNGLPSDKYMADLFKDRNISFKYKNDFETFNGTPEYSYAIYNPDNVVWKKPFKFSRKQEDLLKLYDIGVAGNYSTDPNHITVNLKNLYAILKDFPKYRLPNHKNGKLPCFSDGKSPIHIKPANRGKFTALKKRTGHSASWFKENGTPAQKKMAVFALNAKKWKH